MGKDAGKPLLEYGVAILAVAVAIFIRWLLDSLLDHRLPFITLYGAVAIAIWIGGWKPALFAIILGYGAADLLFIETELDTPLSLKGWGGLAALVVYLISCLIVVGFGEGMRAARRRAEARQRQLEQAEEAISQRERLFSTLVHSFSQSVWQHRPDGTAIQQIDQANAAWWREFTGQTEEQRTANGGLGWLDAVHEEDRKTARRNWLNIVSASKPTATEFRTRRRDGAWRRLLVRGVPVRDDCGAIIEWAGTMVDVTEQRQAEEALRQTTEQLQLVTESMAAPITRCSRDLKYLWVSNPYADWIGRTPEEIVGRPILDILGHEAFEQLRPRFEQVLAGKKVQYETAINYRGLGLRWINAIYTPTFDAAGVPDGWVAVVLDITERRRMEDQLRQRAEEIEKLMELLPLGVFIAHDPDCRRITGNRAGYELLRLPVGTNLSVTPPAGEEPPFIARRNGRPLPPDQLPIQYAAAHAVEVRDVEVEHVFPDGTTYTLFGSASPLFDPQGQVRGCVASFLDITERKRLEAELQQRVEQLAEADRRKDEFLATLAHELRNPLAPIRNALELMKRADGNRTLMGQARSMMERQLGQMVRLIDDLLDISRITRGKLQLRKERVELAAAVRSAVEAAHPLIDAQAHELTVTLADEPVYLDADPTRLAQVISNLLNNAAKFTEKGGHIWLTAERHGEEVVVSVRDTGLGIAAQHLAHIFEMFSQVASALERSHGGLGIGLALVRGLVELHGGKVEARGAGPGRGSEFIVRLPVVGTPMQVRGAPSEDSENSQVGPKCRILIADDSLAMMLRLAGHDIQTAYDGLEAVQAAATFRPDVVLLDIGMPKLNGYEAARSLREQPWGKHMVLVALTGWGQEEYKRRATEAGFDHHLTKPVEPAALEKLLALISPVPHRSIDMT